MGSGRRVIVEETRPMSITREEMAKEIYDFLSLPETPHWKEGWFNVNQWTIFSGKDDRDEMYKPLRKGYDEKKLERKKDGHTLYYRSVNLEIRERMIEFWTDYLKESSE